MLRDLHFALRLIAKERWFSAAAIVVLALGIGVNATGFTLVSGVFLRELSFRDANQIYILSWRAPSGRGSGFSLADLEDWRAQSQSFAHVAGVIDGSMNISDDRGLPAQVYGARVTSDAFAVFEHQPLLGRVFTPDDQQKGASAVVVIGRRLWRQRYGDDPSVLGSTLRVNGMPATIIGVMPEGIRFPGNAEVWTPFIPTTAQESRANRPLNVFARLKPDVSRRAAQAEASGIAQRLIAAHRDEIKEFTDVVVETVPERFVGGPARPMFIVLMVAVSFVLLIACANVANLLLSRSVYRAREVAMRMMLGASRLRVVRQLLVESTVLAGAGGALGLLLAVGGVRLFEAAIADPTRPYFIVFTVDYVIFAYVAAIGVVTAIVAGLAPAVHVSGENSNAVIREHARGSIGSVRTRWFSGAMVVAQLALTVVLLTGAGLMTRSFYKLQSAESGYDSRRLVVTRLQLPNARYATAESRRDFYDRLEARLASVPGIESAALVNAVPPFKNEERRVEIEGRPSEEPPPAAVVRIGPAFFAVLDRKLSRGRTFEPSDAAAGSEGVIVNERFARQFLADEDPIGRRLRFVQRQSDGTITPTPWRTIVGIAPAIRYGVAEATSSDPVVYTPAAFEPPTITYLLLRTPLPPGAVANDIRRAVQAVDADQPVFGVQTIDDIVRERRWPYTAFGGAFAIFAAIALVLSTVGLYAVMAYSVTQRTQEIGVRMAVGAQPLQVVSLFLRRGVIQITIGLALGFAGAFALSGALQRMLVEVAPGDPVTFGTVALALVGVATGACLLPARRASQIDPLVALRQE